MGVLAFFGEKYNPEEVRVVKVPEFSMELCGGTHVPRTGDIGTFKITDVTALSAGHRRIVAVTGPRAIDLFQDTFNTSKKLSQQFKVKREEVLDTVERLYEKSREQEKEIAKLKQQMIAAQLPSWHKQIKEIKNIPFLFIALKNADGNELREITSLLQNKQSGFYIAVSDLHNRTQFVANLSPQFSDRIDLKKFGSFLKDEHGIRGGGTKNILQGAGGKFDAKLESAIIDWLASH